MMGFLSFLSFPNRVWEGGKGNTGEAHYFEHASGQVADVKFFPSSVLP